MSLGNSLVLTGLAVLGIALMSPSPPKRAGAPGADRPLAAVSPLKRGGIGLAANELERAPDGHFYAEARVNGVTIHFMVDTGASVVMLTPEDAQRAGIAVPTERALAAGVGGTVSVAPVMIDRLSLGPLEARSIQGAVADQLPVSLLGQNFLAQLGSVEIRGDRMLLR